MANAGDTVESAARQYEIQWAEASTTCGAIPSGNYVGVADSADEFAMSASTNLTDGQTVTGTLLSNTEAYSFTNGEGRDVTDTTASLGPLNASTVTELEFSITPTATAADATRYCFRVRDALAGTPLDGYATYPSLVMAAEDSTQLHFIWRDDASDLNTLSGTLGVEDSNAIASIDRGVTRRIRIAVANLGAAAEDAGRQYELEFAPKVTTCAAVSSWTGVDDTTDEFQMVDSVHISPDGESSSTGFLTLPGSYSRITGEGRDSADTSSSRGPLDTDEMVELEYSITPGETAVTGQSYCFRLYDAAAGSALDSYSVYPELTIDAVNSNRIGEFGTVSLTNNTWETVNFTNTYTNPVVVGSARYDPDTDAQREVRVRNKTSTQFDVKVDNSAGSLTATTTVDYIVMESGTFGMDSGSGTLLVQAGSENTDGTFCNTDTISGTPATVTFNPAFSGTPIVLTTVASNSDTAWTSTHIDDGTTLDNDPTTSTMRMTLNVGWNACSGSPHGAEDIDYIAFEEGVHGTNNAVEFDTQLGVDTVSCCDAGNGYETTFTSAFSSAPEVTVISQSGEDGGNGSYAVTSTGRATTASTHYGSADEDGTGSDRTHTTESVALVAFDASSGTILTDASIFDQTHYRIYENIDAVQPTTALAAENTRAEQVTNGQVIRLRMAVQVGGTDLSASEQAFTLQYVASTNCAAEADGSWTDVDGTGGSGIWRGFDNASPADGATLSANLLSLSDIRASYEEANDSAANPLSATVGQRLEYDWVVQNNGAASGNNYCFRMVLDDGDAIHYYRYPQVRTGGPLRGAIIMVD